MSDHCPSTVPRKVAAPRDGTRGRLFLGLAAFTLIRASEAMAADQTVNLAVTASQNDAHPPMAISAAPFAATRDEKPGPWSASTIIPGDYSLPPAAAEARVYSSTEFRPRGHSVFDTDKRLTTANDNLMIDRTVWQRLSEYRNRDSVRVITLWESGASAVSIQTNRKGGPSLEWTSRFMNRGGATRGLLDRWMPATVFKSFSHSASSPSGKSPNPPPLPRPGIAAIP